MDIKQILKYMKLHESAISVILGIVVVLISGAFLVRYLTTNDGDEFAPLNIGDVTPNLTEAFPKNEDAFINNSPTINPNLNNPKNTSSTSTEVKTYTVQKGDNLWKIAESEYGSGYNWTDIAKANKIGKADKIEVGQTIFLPNVSPKLVTVKEVKSEQVKNPINDSSYTVQKGDTLWSISVRAYGDGYKWPSIAKSNKITHPNIIYTGNVLTLPR